MLLLLLLTWLKCFHAESIRICTSIIRSLCLFNFFSHQHRLHTTKLFQFKFSYRPIQIAQWIPLPGIHSPQLNSARLSSSQFSSSVALQLALDPRVFSEGDATTEVQSKLVQESQQPRNRSRARVCGVIAVQRKFGLEHSELRRNFNCSAIALVITVSNR